MLRLIRVALVTGLLGTACGEEAQDADSGTEVTRAAAARTSVPSTNTEPPEVTATVSSVPYPEATNVLM